MSSVSQTRRKSRSRKSPRVASSGPANQKGAAPEGAPPNHWAANEIPPEWKALLDASSEIEKENRQEREKNRNLALQLIRLQFENEVLAEQVESANRRIRELESRLESQLRSNPLPVAVPVQDPAVEKGITLIAQATELRALNAHQARLIQLSSARTREVVYLSELYRLRSQVQDPEIQAQLIQFENLIEQAYEAVSTASRLSAEENENTLNSTQSRPLSNSHVPDRGSARAVTPPPFPRQKLKGPVTSS